MLSIAVVGLSADLGTFVAAPLGAPANLVAAIVKAIIKAIPPPVSKAIVQIGGGGMRGLRLLSGYIGHFLSNLTSVSDWVNLDKIRQSVSAALTQVYTMIDSPIVRQGGLDASGVSSYVGDAVNILADRGRALADEAAEGITAFARHGNDGLDGTAAMTDLINRFPANVADDSAESVSTAISKTYRDSPLLDGVDPDGIRRVDDAVKAARSTLDPHLRSVVDAHIGPSSAIKSMEEFEALRFMRAENLTTEQTQAMIAIRNAIPNPVTGTPMQKAIKGTRIDDFITQNSDITGFVAKADDAGTAVFQSSDDMIEGLRLDYEGGFQTETSVGIIEWDFDAATMDTGVPRSPSFGGAVTDPFPFVGNGFTATSSGHLVPEYRLTGSVGVPEGAALFELSADGTKTLRATSQGGSWVPVQ